MSLVRCGPLSLKHVMLILSLHNYVCKSDSNINEFSRLENILNLPKNSVFNTEVIKQIEQVLNFRNFSTLKNFVSLSNNSVFTTKDISNSEDLYLAGLKNEDIYLNGTQLIQKYGYKVEEHNVTTSDGYILTLWRIPGNGRVIFLMHGLLSSSVDWLTVGSDQCLPYLLADQGYDVWMGNARGNKYSRKHVHLSPSDADFWKFSFNEIGSIDLPTMIDYVLAKTGEQKLTYIGHSQGTTAFFILCSTKPEYNDKVDFMVALSAVAWMKHITSPIFQIIAPTVSRLPEIGVEFLPGNDLMRALTLTLCGNAFLAFIICQNVAFLICGFSYSQTNFKHLPVIYNHSPAGSSLMQIIHYEQLIESGYFRDYDHGSALNLIKYGSAVPPSYPVENISVPIAIFQSHGDWLASDIDVAKLRSKLQNVVDFCEVPVNSFNHVDYLWARDVKKLVYDPVLSLIKQN